MFPDPTRRLSFSWFRWVCAITFCVPKECLDICQFMGNRPPADQRVHVVLFQIMCSCSCALNFVILYVCALVCMLCVCEFVCMCVSVSVCLLICLWLMATGVLPLFLLVLAYGLWVCLWLWLLVCGFGLVGCGFLLVAVAGLWLLAY